VGSPHQASAVRKLDWGFPVPPRRWAYHVAGESGFDQRHPLVRFCGARALPSPVRVEGGVMAISRSSILGNWGDEGSASSMSDTNARARTSQRTIASMPTTAAYWKCFCNTAEGSLTLGLNRTALRYEKNLRFFTVGHGGYFSPQRLLPLQRCPCVGRGGCRSGFQYTIGASSRLPVCSARKLRSTSTMSNYMGVRTLLTRNRQSLGANYK
jgi:hypothetical protein